MTKKNNDLQQEIFDYFLEKHNLGLLGREILYIKHFITKDLKKELSNVYMELNAANTAAAANLNLQQMQEKELEETVKQYNAVVEQNRTLQAELRQKTAEYQKLISENEELQEANEQYTHINKNLDYMLDNVISLVLGDDEQEEYFYTELKDKFTSKLQEIMEQNKQRKQALDEIEKYCKTHYIRDMADVDILEIIWRVKDGEE